MAFKSIGFVGIPKTDKEKRYMRLNKGVKITVTLENGQQFTLQNDGTPKSGYINMFTPRKGEKQSEEQYEELKAWKRFDLCIAVDE